VKENRKASNEFLLKLSIWRELFFLSICLTGKLALQM